jgi:hypothetical protein
VAASISDYSPDWSYTTGGGKVLITGPWYARANVYACVFDTFVVPAEFVQPGVLKCTAPGTRHTLYIHTHCVPAAHAAGRCSLCVMCDSHVISNVVPFEYVFDSRQHLHSTQATTAQHEHHELLSRLEHLYASVTQYNAAAGMPCNGNNHVNG